MINQMKKYFRIPTIEKTVTPSIFIMVFTFTLEGVTTRHLKWAVAYDLEVAITKVSIFHAGKHYSPTLAHISLNSKIGLEEIRSNFKRCF